jgi:hypothetical protein
MKRALRGKKTVYSTILLKLAANGLQHVLEKWVWSVARSASLGNGGTSKKRPSPHHLQKFRLGVIM